MKLVTYLLGSHVSIGAVEPQGVVDLSAIAPDMLSLIDGGPVMLDRARAAIGAAPDFIPIEQITSSRPFLIRAAT